MGRFINIPNQDEGVVLLLHSKYIKKVLCVDERVYLTVKKEGQVVCDFETPEQAKDFLQKNFVLFNA